MAFECGNCGSKLIYNFEVSKIIHRHMYDCKNCGFSVNLPKEETFTSRIISLNDRYEVLKRQKWRCNFCSIKLKFNKYSNFGEEVAHIDHIHPFSRKEDYPGGSENINEISNLQALCPDCNLKKSKREVN